MGSYMFWFSIRSIIVYPCDDMLTRLLSCIAITKSDFFKRHGQNRQWHNSLAHLRDRFWTATDTAKQTSGRNRPVVSACTGRRSLKHAGLRPRRLYNGHLLTSLHCRGCLNWTMPSWLLLLVGGIQATDIRLYRHTKMLKVTLVKLLNLWKTLMRCHFSTGMSWAKR